MNASARTLVILLLLIVLGVGTRLMFYGLQTLISSPSAGWLSLPWFFAGVVLFIGGIVIGVLSLDSETYS